MISFVSHGDKTLQRLVGMPGEQEHHILSVRFLFFFIAVSEINLWKPLKIVYNRKTEL